MDKGQSEITVVSEITIEIAYALADQQLIVPIKASHTVTVEQAIKASGILDKFPDINLNINKIGIFGKTCNLDSPLRHLDRIEIYRPLIADPKEVRKQRVAHDSGIKKGGERSPPEV